MCNYRTCFKASPSLYQMLMGNLTKEKTIYSAVDFSGSFLIQNTSINMKTFICFDTHLKIISELTLQTFKETFCIKRENFSYPF